MDERTLRALVEAGAVRRVLIVGDGCQLTVEVRTQAGSVTASTQRGVVRTWRSLDAAARWVRGLGVGTAEIQMERWQPSQRELLSG